MVQKNNGSSHTENAYCYSWLNHLFKQHGFKILHKKENMLKYETVANDILLKIANGFYPAGSRLPTTSELCDSYGVSKATINKSLEELTNMGYISRVRGSGTYVKHTFQQLKELPSDATEPSNNQSIYTITGTKARFEKLGKNVTSNIHVFDIIKAPKNVANALGISEGAFVYEIRRSRFVDDNPLSIEHTYMPVSLIPNLTMEVLESSIYDYIEDTLGLAITSAHSAVRAVLPTEQDCEWLHIEPNTPLLEIEQTAYLSNGTTFEYSIARHTRAMGDLIIVRPRQFAS